MSKFVRFFVRFLLSKCPYTRYLSSQIALERGVARVCAFSTEVDNGLLYSLCILTENTVEDGTSRVKKDPQDANEI